MYNSGTMQYTTSAAVVLTNEAAIPIEYSAGPVSVVWVVARSTETSMS